MLVTSKEICEIAQEKGIGIGAFNGANLESLTAIIEAAEELKLPVIVQHAEVHESLIPIEVIGPIMIDMAKKASVPVCVHLDHGESFDECMKALRIGFSSIMIDASAKPFEENIATTAKVVEIAHAMGASVEAELGNILVSDVPDASHEGGVAMSSANASDCYTNPDEAKKFVDETGVDILAISFGTAHGIYASKPVLDLERITEIKNKIDIPFVMHGGSGLSKKEFQTAIKNGVCKINYYTYMALAGADGVMNFLDGKTKKDNVQFHDIAIAGKVAMKEDVKNAMKIFAMQV